MSLLGSLLRALLFWNVFIAVSAGSRIAEVWFCDPSFHAVAKAFNAWGSISLILAI